MNKRFVIGLACLVSLTTACAARPSANSSPDGTVRVWVDAARQPVVQGVAEQFMRTTGTKVEVEAHDATKIPSEFLSATARTPMPDVILTGSEWTGRLVAAESVSPVDLGVRTGSFQDVAIKAVTHNGKVYGVPFALDNLALIRNTEMAEHPAPTFGDLQKSGEALVANKTATRAVAIGDPRPNNADAYALFPVQSSFGAGVFSQNADGSYDASRVTLNQDGGALFARWLDAFGRSGDYDPNLTADAALAEFTAGTLPYLVAGPGALPALKKSGVKYVIEAVPPAGDKPATVFVTAPAFFVASKSKNAVAAHKFVADALADKQAQADLATVSQRPPALKDAWGDGGDGDTVAFGKVGSAGVPLPNVTQLEQVWPDWAATEATLLRGASGDPAAEWKTMSDAVVAKAK